MEPRPFTRSFTQQEPISDEGIAAAVQVLRSGRLHRYNTVGDELSEAALLEREFANYQGSRYALWLLEDRIDASALRQRLVAAYVIGYAIPNDWFERRVKTIRPCKATNDTGCVLSWSSYAEGSTPDLARLRHRYGAEWEANGAKPLVCTNPLGWSSAAAEAEVNIGAWVHGDGATPLA